MDVLSALQQVSRASNSSQVTSALGGVHITDPQETTQADGTKKITFAIDDDQKDFTIPISTWKLRLLPTKQHTGALHIPFELVVSATDDFVSLKVTVAQLELEADPTDLVAADLHTEPFTYLTPSPGNHPVRLLGPGLTFTFKGSDLSDVGVDVTGDSASTTPTFPSARFEPPHFLIGGTEVGIVCDEVLLDLDREHNPDIVDQTLPGVTPAWRGLMIKELGVFIGDGREVGTWCGMASMKDFFMGFDSVDITGLFTAELVHNVLSDPPQVEVTATYADAAGDTQSTTSDVTLPLLPAGYGRVRLEARPNWDSAGFHVAWTLPPGVSVDNPGRLSSLDLGWVNVPPGDHTFTVLVTDNRVPDQTVTRVVQVAPPAPPAGANPLSLVLEGFPVFDPDDVNDRATQRVHMRMRPEQTGVVTLHLGGGSGSPIQATLTPPPGYTLTVPATQTAQRPANVNNYSDVAWGFATSHTAPAPVDGSFVVSLTDGGTTFERRLRVTWEAAPVDGAPDFELRSYTDWRPDPGVGLARINALNGLDFADLVWTLDRQSIDATLFSDSSKDALFVDGAAFETSETISLSNSAGTVRPYLPQPDSLYRLVGSVVAAPATARPPIVIAETGALSDDAVTGFTGNVNPVAFDDPDATTIHFAYDSPEIQPTTAKTGPEPAAVRLSLDTVNELQAKGFVSIFRAVARYGEAIESIGLFGAASVEGEDAYNLQLSHNRVDAAKAALLAPPPALTAKMTEVTGFVMPATVPAILSALDAGGDIQSLFFGELHAHQPIDPHDRRVFAVLKLKATLPVSAVAHREYFVTLPGAPAPASSPLVPFRKLQKHPFDHSIFRLGHVEVQFLRNELTRLQIKLVLDLNKFNSNDLPDAPHDTLPTQDGVTTLFFELKRNPQPAAGQPKYSWELVALADPKDADGLAVVSNAGVLGVIGGPSVVLPALTALSGGKTGLSGFAIAVATGVFLSEADLLDVSQLIWRGVRAKIKHGDIEPIFSFALDYTVKYNINCNLQEKYGIPVNLTTQKPIEISFRNVGIEIQGKNQPQFFYNPEDGFSIDVHDPGVFKLGDGIGRLLRVNDFNGGAGSPVWFQVELGLSIDTGIFTLDTLRIRISLDAKDLFPTNGVVDLDASAISLDDLSVSINKIGVSANVPGVLRGSGALGFSSEGGGLSIEGQLDLSIVPLDLRIYGGMKFVSKDDLISLYAFLGTVFSPGIPLGSTGVAIYGFEGLFAAHMARNNPDLLAWYKGPPPGATDVGKWSPKPGAWAFGVGTVLGTVYDDGFTFNTKGGLMLELPGPKISLATLTNFAQGKPGLKSNDQGTLVSTILLDFENHIFLVNLDFTYEVPSLIKIHVPVEVYFNLSEANDWHIRFGQWDPESSRVSIRILNLFDAYGYFVVEGKGVTIPDFLDLKGISIAHGSRAEIFWGSKSVGIYLEAFFEYHIGLQIDPILLQGAARVGGKLHLGPCSLGASGTLAVKAPDPFVIQGEFCGEIDLWLFSISGCVSFSIGDGDAGIPDPPNPFQGLTVIDRMTSAQVDDANAVPLDAVVHLAFNQDVTDRCVPPAISLSPGPFRNQISGDLFYEYDLGAARIVDQDTGIVVAPLQKAWGAYTLPNATAEEAGSNRTLRLLSWVPSSHDRAVDFESGYGDTLAVLVASLCDPTKRPVRSCVTFDAQPFGPGDFWDLQGDPLGHVFVTCTQSNGLGVEYVGGVLGFGSARVVPLPPVTYTNRAPTQRSLRLPTGSRRFHTSLAKLFPGLTKPGKTPVADLGGPLGRDSLTHVAQIVREAADSPATGALATSSVSVASAVAAGFDTAVRSKLTALEFAVRPQIAAAVNTNPTYQATVFLAGLLFVRLPDLVEVDATFIVPSKVAADGEVVFLDAAFKPLSPVFSFHAAAVAPGSAAASPEYVGYDAKRIGFHTTAGLPKGATPARIGWMVVNAPVALSATSARPTAAFLDEVCGITFGAWKAWQDRLADIEATIAILTSQTGVVGGIPAASTQFLLDPGHTYRVEGGVGWTRFREAGAGSDDGKSSSPFPLGGTFRASTEAPKEIRRYVLGHDPTGDDQPHYYKERLKLTFASDVVDRIFNKYGLQLVARVKANVEKHAVNQPMSAGTTAEFFPYGGFETTLFEALQSMSGECLPGDWIKLFPKSVHTFPEDLWPNRSYTFTLIPRPLGEPAGLDPAAWNDLLQADQDADRAVFRYDLRTSRYGDFPEHVAAYGDGDVLDVYAEGEAELDAALAALPNDRSDEAMDALMAALFGGPAKIPDRPQVLRVWVATGPPPGPFDLAPLRCRAIVLDGPEPLFKLNADGSEKVARTAQRLSHLGTGFGPAPTPLANARWIVSARGARAVLVFNEPTPPVGVAIRLVYSPVGGAPVTASVVLAVGSEPASSEESA